MIEKTSARFLVGAMNLLAVSPVLVTQVSHAAAMDQLNIASLKSIESTWINVPNVCKARGFNASPVALESNEISSHIQNIYTSFGV